MKKEKKTLKLNSERLNELSVQQANNVNGASGQAPQDSMVSLPRTKW